MKFTVTHQSQQWQGDFSQPIDLSIPTLPTAESAVAWYVDPAKIEAVRTDRFVGSVAEGGAVNFRNILFNPHGNTTHIECVGHIANEVYSVNQCFRMFSHLAQLITVEPTEFSGPFSAYFREGDQVITRQQLEECVQPGFDALILRTLPNTTDKLHCNWNNVNWPYLLPEAADFLREMGIKHLLLDLPSVDREEDGGKLLAHHAFWNYPKQPRMDATITEMIYAPNDVVDGIYFLQLQMASFENDASPCKPVIYALNN
jgi:kynurenine formamidase